MVWDILIWAVPVLTLAYGLGDYWRWWDRLTGRASLEAAYERLRSADNYPVNMIYEGEAEFRPLLKWALSNANSDELVENRKMGALPTAFTRGGGDEVVTPMPQDWPKAVFIPDSSPILALYKYTTDNREGAKAVFVADLRTLAMHSERHRNRERFLVTTILLGVLSVLLAWKETV